MHTILIPAVQVHAPSGPRSDGTHAGHGVGGDLSRLAGMIKPPVMSRGRFLVKGRAAVLVLLSVSDVGHRASRALLPLDEPGGGERIKCHLGLPG